MKWGSALSVIQEFLVTGFCILTIAHLSSRAEHVKENGLTYPSPGIANGIKLSPQETRPSSPAALPSAGEKVKDLLLLSCCPWGYKGKLGQTGACRNAAFCGQLGMGNDTKYSGCDAINQSCSEGEKERCAPL